MKIIKNKHKSKLIIIEDSSLLVLRKNGRKRYVLVGGFLKKGESPEEALVREVFEETGVRITQNDFKYFTTNTVIDCNDNAFNRHYFILRKNGQNFRNNEPEKFKSLQWIKWTKVLKHINCFDKNTIERLFTNIN